MQMTKLNIIIVYCTNIILQYTTQAKYQLTSHLKLKNIYWFANVESKKPL